MSGRSVKRCGGRAKVNLRSVRLPETEISGNSPAEEEEEEEGKEDEERRGRRMRRGGGEGG